MILFLLAAAIVVGGTAYFYNHQQDSPSDEPDQDVTSEPDSTGDSSPLGDPPPPKPKTTDSGDVVGVAMEIIKDFEGFSPIPYKDDYKPTPAIEYSIGYGHQIKPGENLTRISETQALNLLAVDVSKAWGCVIENCKVELTTNQAASLTSFCYNIGCSAFASSTMLRKLNAGDYESAADEFPKWIKSGGKISSVLVTRRQEERDLFEA